MPAAWPCWPRADPASRSLVARRPTPATQRCHGLTASRRHQRPGAGLGFGPFAVPRHRRTAVTPRRPAPRPDPDRATGRPPSRLSRRCAGVRRQDRQRATLAAAARCCRSSTAWRDVWNYGTASARDLGLIWASGAWGPGTWGGTWIYRTKHGVPLSTHAGTQGAGADVTWSTSIRRSAHRIGVSADRRAGARRAVAYARR